VTAHPVSGRASVPATVAVAILASAAIFAVAYAVGAPAPPKTTGLGSLALFRSSADWLRRLRHSHSLSLPRSSTSSGRCCGSRSYYSRHCSLSWCSANCSGGSRDSGAGDQGRRRYRAGDEAGQSIAATRRVRRGWRLSCLTSSHDPVPASLGGSTASTRRSAA
jgi:hypothetical protein